MLRKLFTAAALAAIVAIAAASLILTRWKAR